MKGVMFGFGGIAQQSHLPAIRGLAAEGAAIEVVAAVDPRFAGTTIEGIPVVGDASDLRGLDQIDFIDICTPTSTHVDLVLWGLERGCHVLCEKPVALDVAEARRISDAARRARRVVFPCHQHRFNPAWLQLRRWLEEGAIGRWHLAEFQVYRPHADAGSAGPGVPWRGQGNTSLGGVLLDHGTHLLYLLMDVAGEPATVQAWTARLRHTDYDVEDTAQVLLDFGGRAGTLFLTWAGASRENRIRFIGESGELEWRGGELRLDAGARHEHRDFTAALDKKAYAGWFQSLFREFLTAIEQQDGAAHLADLSRVAEVLSLAYRSAQSGQRLAFGSSA